MIEKPKNKNKEKKENWTNEETKLQVFTEDWAHSVID